MSQGREDSQTLHVSGVSTTLGQSYFVKKFAFLSSDDECEVVVCFRENGDGKATVTLTGTEP